MLQRWKETPTVDLNLKKDSPLARYAEPNATFYHTPPSTSRLRMGSVKVSKLGVVMTDLGMSGVDG